MEQLARFLTHLSDEWEESDTASLRPAEAVQPRHIVPALVRNRPVSVAEFVRYAGKGKHDDPQTKRPLAAVLTKGRYRCQFPVVWLTRGVLGLHNVFFLGFGQGVDLPFVLLGQFLN